jgi:hypothetical protein
MEQKIEAANLGSITGAWKALLAHYHLLAFWMACQKTQVV